jgi:fused signal recognition particle receptor
MEGGTSPDLVTAAILAGGLLATVLLLIYAIRRARKSRLRQIEEAGEDRPTLGAKPKRAALRAEDVEGDEEAPSSDAIPPEETVTSVPLRAHPERPAAPERAHEETVPPSAIPQSPVPSTREVDAEKLHVSPPAPSVPSPSVTLPTDKPRSERPSQPKARDKTALSPGLARTRAGWVSRLGQLFVGKREIDPALVEEIEKVLLTADIGVRTSQKLLEEIRASLGRRELAEPKAVWDYLRKRSIDFLRVEAPKLDFAKAKPFVLLTIGVNGSGKTTTIGKLASKFKAEGRSVLLAAGDTFRAAATEQLEVWGARVGAPVVRGKEASDPSSVIFDGIKRASNEGFDVVIADTAGRLHTKANLMEELQKVRRVAGKALDGAPHETWLVIDATSGQNAIAQAQIFTQAMSVTGIVLTKLDGTAKGGVILGIADQLGIPVRYIGVGERVEDLREFDAEEFVEALFDQAEAG